MNNENPPFSSLERLENEVLSLPPAAALPCNLPDIWLDMIARDLEEVMGPNAHVGEAAGKYAAAPLALILRILQGKSPCSTLTMSCEIPSRFDCHSRACKTKIN
jgi:hypothetical protein